jgi:hypothetical protein
MRRAAVLLGGLGLAAGLWACNHGLSGVCYIEQQSTCAEYTDVPDEKTLDDAKQLCLVGFQGRWVAGPCPPALGGCQGTFVHSGTTTLWYYRDVDGGVLTSDDVRKRCAGSIFSQFVSR